METQIKHNGKSYILNLNEPIDISIPVSNLEQVNCFYAPPFKAYPFESGDFIGSTQKGAPVNFFNVEINPHGNGTHTECVGHISKEGETINQSLQKFHFVARLVSLPTEKLENGDSIVKEENFIKKLDSLNPEALIIRTHPNPKKKKTLNYSGKNPTYFNPDLIEKIQKTSVNHLVVDLPSVDREEDEGKLLSHHAFWQYPFDTQRNRTITELVYISDDITDGDYLLNIQIASFEIDVSPSKIVLYKLKEIFED